MVQIVTQIIYQIVLINKMIKNEGRIVNDLQAQRNYSDSSRTNDIYFPHHMCYITLQPQLFFSIPPKFKCGIK